MLNPNYNYICFDFETTGLDTKKDEPIQIGIVKFDHKFQIIDTFTSLIKPKKNIKELKGIVQRVTGFKLDDLENAANAKEVFEKCKYFFIENTVIIGHNIGFDLSFLQRYIDFTPKHQIDTFPLSKTFFHFQSSYALDILNKQLQKKGKGWSGKGAAHDALYDSYSNMMLFKYCITRFNTLRHEYVLLDYVLQESKETFKDIIDKSEKQYTFENKKLFFPPLKTYSKSNKKIVMKGYITFPDSKENKRYTGNISFANLIKNIDRTTKKYVLSFTHRSKVVIAQQYLEKLDIPYNSLHDNVIFPPKRVNAFLQKKDFTDAEVFFVTKYFSQYAAGHNMIEVNSLNDYKIFHAITSLKTLSNKDIVLCTHQQLFQFSHKIKKENTILFFDQDRRYQNYSKWMKQAFDPLYLINLIDQLCYKYKLQGEQELFKLANKYMNTLSIFIGALSIEINKLFTGYNHPKQEIEYILEHTRFPKTQSLFPKVKKHTKILLEKVTKEDAVLVDKQRQRLQEYLSTLCTVEKKMYDGNKRYYLLHNRNLYLSYENFIQQLPTASYKFLSNSNTSLTHLSYKKTLFINKQNNKKIPESKKEDIQVKTITDHKVLAEKLSTSEKSQYILSSSKERSQELFQELIKHKTQKNYTIVAENITGGVGKNIYIASNSTKPVIMIGGYNFYLESKAKKFDFSLLYLYHIYGKMKKQIVHDILYYGL